MWLALFGHFRAKWSAEIHNEWKRNLFKNRPDMNAEQLDRTSDLMNQALPDASVTGHEVLIEGLTLPDIDDRHVLAAAICCNANVIVTFNQKDFPRSALVPFGIEAQHPDEFVCNLFDLDSAAVVGAAQRQRKQLKMPPLDVSTYLDLLFRQGLIKSAKTLLPYKANSVSRFQTDRTTKRRS